MKVLGVDPGSRLVGFGCLEAHGNRLRFLASGVIDVRAECGLPKRLEGIYSGLLGVLDRELPDVMVLEEIFYGRNVQSLVRIGEGRGVALLAAATRHLEVVQYTPAMVKKALTGRGGAHKAQVARMVERLLGIDGFPGGYDASDALALAICHVHRHSSPLARLGVEPTRRRRARPRKEGSFLRPR
ncbi:MAG: crossover junction endodeoxyribonuclease RuvC [Planctomycetota bacterium]